MSRRSVRTGGLVIGSGFLVLIIGFSLAWLGGYGYLPLDPHLVVGATIFLLCFTLCLSATLMMVSTTIANRQNMSTIPEALREGYHSRLIRESENREEVIIQAHENSSIREVLEDNWPFKKKKSGDWYVVDERGNDVTNWPISIWDGIAIVRFRE